VRWAAIIVVICANSGIPVGVASRSHASSARRETASSAIDSISGVSDPQSASVRHTREQWLDQVPTFGGHSTFPDATLAELVSGLGAVIDAAGGGFTMRYTAVALTASLAPRT
jgi:hypothetical protein